jgi:hypothetical protein
MCGLSQKATSVGDWSERRECASTLAVIFGLIWFCLAWAELGVVDMPHNPWVPAALARTAFILALSRLRFFSQCAPLLYIGQRTMPIYLLHVFCVARTRIGMMKIMGINNIAITMPIAFLYGIALPIAVFEMARQLAHSARSWTRLGTIPQFHGAEHPFAARRRHRLVPELADRRIFDTKASGDITLSPPTWRIFPFRPPWHI